MKSPETNSANTNDTDVWTENHWNLPYDLGYVNEVRSTHLETERPSRLRRIQQGLGRVASGVLMTQLDAFDRVITSTSELASSTVHNITDNVGYKVDSAFASPQIKQERNRYLSTAAIHEARAQSALENGDQKMADTLFDYAEDNRVWHEEAERSRKKKWFRKKQRERQQKSRQ